MQVVYDKIVIDYKTAGRSPANNIAMKYRSVHDLRHKQESTNA